MKREFSAGGIVFKIENDQPVFLLIKNAQLKDPSKSYWGFPKGHIEGKESAAEAAVREVGEETGLKVNVLEKVDDSKYVFTNKEKEKIFKVVTIFLMEYLEGKLDLQASEISDADWFKAEDALNILSFPNDKTLLKKAMKKLTSDEI